MLYLRTMCPCLQVGDGVGCTHASSRKVCGISGFCKRFQQAWNDRIAYRKYATLVVNESRSSHALTTSFFGYCNGKNSENAIIFFNDMKNSLLRYYKDYFDYCYATLVVNESRSSYALPTSFFWILQWQELRKCNDFFQ